MAIWQAYVDDSGQGHRPVMVLGGFIASAENWAALAGEWQNVLSMRPGIAYFKMSEAASLKGEFEGISEQSRDEKVAILYHCLEEHVTAAVSASMPREPFYRIFNNMNNSLARNPYYILFFDLVLGIGRNKQKLNIDTNVDFVFDNQMGEKGRIIEAWEALAALPKAAPFIGQIPIFRDSKTMLPLQAADLHAWWAREKHEAAIFGRPIRSFRFKTRKPMPHLHFEWTESKLQNAYRHLVYQDVPPEVLVKLGLWPV